MGNLNSQGREAEIKAEKERKRKEKEIQDDGFNGTLSV